MRLALSGRLLWAALFAAPAFADPVLEVRLDHGPPLVSWTMADGDEVCLTWNHSVTGGEVADCFVQTTGTLTLARSYLHDFAAGLGEVQGRGHLVSAEEGGYWIDDINEPVAGNQLTLRIGSSAVDHRLHRGRQEFALSQRAPGQRARIVLRQPMDD